MNHLQNFFQGIGIFSFIVGLFTLYGNRFLPISFLHFFNYGRANQSKDKNKLKIIRMIEVPKSWFAHFYLYTVALQLLIVYSLISIYQNPYPAKAAWSSYIFSILTVLGGKERAQTVDSTTTVFAALLFLFQVSRRLYECWFVSIYSGTKMNIFHYVVAFFHYTGSVFTILSHSIGFAEITQNNISPITASHSHSDSDSWTLCYKNLNAFHLFGGLLFLYGSYQQYKVHVQYANLRKGGKNEVVSYEHRIPTGGLFELVSCPNYLVEILIYVSFSIIFGFVNTTWNAIVLWVACNQIIGAVMNHMWCLKKFPNYPKDRKAIIPFLW